MESKTYNSHVIQRRQVVSLGFQANHSQGLPEYLKIDMEWQYPSDSVAGNLILRLRLV